jgi:hypothetical protein
MSFGLHTKYVARGDPSKRAYFSTRKEQLETQEYARVSVVQTTNVKCQKGLTVAGAGHRRCKIESTRFCEPYVHVVQPD